MRFLYCACAICSFLDDWSTIDTNLAVNFIDSCKAFDGGFGLLPQQESHGTVRLHPSPPPPPPVHPPALTWAPFIGTPGGSTFCATAALVLMGRLEECLPGPEREAPWLLKRQAVSPELDSAA